MCVELLTDTSSYLLLQCADFSCISTFTKYNEHLFFTSFTPTDRLVNGFVENPHKKTGRSISDLAEAVGIPRVLVDIRHG
jgi:hypothetical protein